MIPLNCNWYMVEADYQTHHSADMDIRLNQHRDLQDDPYGQISPPHSDHICINFGNMEAHQQ